MNEELEETLKSLERCEKFAKAIMNEFETKKIDPKDAWLSCLIVVAQISYDKNHAKNNRMLAGVMLEILEKMLMANREQNNT